MRKLRFILFLVLYNFSTIERNVFAQTQSILSDDNQRLMAVQLNDGSPVLDTLPIYQVGVNWFIPIGEISRGLGLAIVENVTERTASGFVIDEQNTFYLDTVKCTFTKVNESQTYPCNESIVYDDDIYVSDALLSKLLPLRVKIDSFRSEISVDPSRRLPMQERKLRAMQKGQFSNVGNAKSNYPEANIPAKNFNLSFLDSQLGVTTERTEVVNDHQFRHDVIASGELLGMEATAVASGSDGTLEHQQYSLAKRDSKSNLLGPLHATEVQLLDVFVPSLPLIGSAGIYRGALLSNYPLNSPSQFGTHDFIGNLAAGWEVELYQNDVLVDRQFSREGRYEFKGIPLTYGLNRFKLSFYGPQGQRRESFESFSIESSLIKPGTSHYRIAVVEDPRADSRTLVQFDKSLHKNLTLISGFSRFALAENPIPKTYGVLGARFFASNILLQSTGAVTENGKYAFENGLQSPLGEAVAGVKYTKVSGFESEVIATRSNLVPSEILNANLSVNVFSEPTIRLTFEGNKINYENGIQNITGIQRTSSKLGPLYWFNTLNYDENGGGLSGELTSMIILSGTEVRAQGLYDSNRFNTASLQLQKPIANLMTVSAGWTNTFANNMHRFNASLNKRFKEFTLTMNGSVENTGNFMAGALASFSLGQEPHSSRLTLDGRARALTGSVSILVFFDENQNGIRDEGELPLPNIRPTINHQEIEDVTNSQGIVFISGLQPWAPTDISISSRSLVDPTHRPLPEGLQITPRPGAIAKIEMPVVSVSEVTGFVRVKQQGELQPKRGVEIQLINANGDVVGKGISEVDGYYFIENVKIGKYQLRINPIQCEKLAATCAPEFYEVEVNADGLLDKVRDFQLSFTFP